MQFNKILLLPLFVLPSLGFAQYDFDYGLKLGASGFLGSIGGITSLAHGRVSMLDLQPSQIRWDVGCYLRYKVSRHLSLNGAFDWIRIQGADSLSLYQPIRDRNLNFRNDIFEASVRAEWTFYENPDVGDIYNYMTSFNAYLFLGVGVFHEDPQAKVMYSNPDYPVGEWVYLNDVGNNGGSPSYSLTHIAIPMGIGFYYTFNKNFRIGWDFCWNKTFTGYLDDVHGLYPPYSDWTYFTNQSKYVPGITKQELSYYAPGDIRGGTNNESFVTSSINIGYVIKGRPAQYADRKFFRKRNYKSRATF